MAALKATSLSTHRIKQMVVDSISDIQNELKSVIERLEKHKCLIDNGSNSPNDAEQQLRQQTMITMSLLKPSIRELNDKINQLHTSSDRISCGGHL